MVKEKWFSFQIYEDINPMDNLVIKLKNLKKETTLWTKKQKEKDKEYMQIYEQMKSLLESNDDSIFNEEEELSIWDLEVKVSISKDGINGMEMEESCSLGGFG